VSINRNGALKKQEEEFKNSILMKIFLSYENAHLFLIKERAISDKDSFDYCTYYAKSHIYWRVVDRISKRFSFSNSRQLDDVIEIEFEKI